MTATSASAAATCKSPAFKRQFYGNTSFSGTPKKTDCDTAVSEDWGTRAPASGVPKDNFGVRWTLTRDFGSGGPFTFTAAAQDGIRVYVDGVRKIDLWKNVTATRKKTVDVSIPSGRHTLRVDFAHWTGSAHVKFGYSPRTSAAVDKVAPLAPTGTSATYDKATGRARLAWAGNEELDLAGYRVYRRVKGDGGWKRLARATATSYTDSPPATGETYVYEIRAYDKAGNESAGGADRPVTTVDRTAPSAPTGVTATDSQPGVTLSWNPVPGAAHYLVHRRWETDAMDEPVVQVAKVTSAGWLDTTAREHLLYSYWVTAVDAAGNKSARSESGLVNRIDHAPSAPTGLTATTKAATGATGIELTWRAPTTPVPEDLWSYRIYRGTRLVDEVRASQRSYLDDRVRHSRAYTYTVTAVDTVGNESTASAPASATAPATGLAPAAVTGLTGVVVGTDLQLTWQRSPEVESVDRYEIHRGQLVDGVWRYEQWDSVGYDWFDESVTYIRDLSDAQGETVRWAVVAVDTDGNSRLSSGEEFSYVMVTEPNTPDGES